MDQRRQLMHVIAIIGVVIGILLHPLPAALFDQRPLDRIESIPAHKDVEIADRPAYPRRQAGRDIGRAFQQHDGFAQRSQHAARHFGFP